MQTKQETSCIKIQRWWRSQYITIECPVCYLTNNIPHNVTNNWVEIGEGRFIKPYTCHHAICSNCFDLWRQQPQGYSCPCCRCPENIYWNDDEYDPETTDDVIMNTQNTLNPNTNPIINPNTNPIINPNTNPIINPNTNPIINPNTNPIINPIINDNHPLINDIHPLINDIHPLINDNQPLINDIHPLINENTGDFYNGINYNINHIANTLIFPNDLDLNIIRNILEIFINNTYNANNRINHIILEMFIHTNYNLIDNELANYNIIITPNNNDRLNITSNIINAFREFLIMDNNINILLNLLNISNNNIIDYVDNNVNINILDLINYVRNSLLNNIHNIYDNPLIMVAG